MPPSPIETNMAGPGAHGRVDPSRGPGRFPVWQRAVGFGVAFFAGAELGRVLSIPGCTFVNFWPPAGLYVAVLLLNEPRSWWWLALAALPANFGFDLLQGVSVKAATGYTLANTAEALAGAWLVRRFVARRPSLATVGEYLGLVGCVAVLSPLLGATIGAGALAVLGLRPEFLRTGAVWWVGDAMSVLLVAPFVLAWFGRPDSGKRLLAHRGKIVEAALLAAGMIGCTWYMLVADEGIHAPYKARIVIFLIWAGLRFGTRGVTAASLLLAFVTTGLTLHYLRGVTPDEIASGSFAITLYSFLTLGAAVALIPAIALEERDRIVGALRDSEARLVLTMDLALIAQWEFDFASRQFIFNEKFYRLLRTTASEEGGLRLPAEEYTRRFMLPEAAAIVIAEGQRAMAASDPSYTRQFEHHFRRKDGSLGVMSVRLAVLMDASGRVVKAFGASQDVTELKRAELALVSSDLLLRQFIKHAPAAIAMFDTDMRYLQASERWLTDYHLDGRDLIGRSHYEVFPNIPERWKMVHRRVLAGEIERADEDPFTRKDGRREWLQWEVRPWHRPDGTVGGLIMFTQMITARKHMEEALRLSEVRFRSAMQHSPIGMSLVSTDGRWLEVNPALCAIVGYSRDELLQRDFQSITHPDDLDTDLDRVRQMLERKIETYQIEKRYRHREGRLVWIQLNVSLVWNPDGTPRYFVSQIQDITARRAAEQALKDNRAKTALAMDMAKLVHWEYDVIADRYYGDENAFKVYGTTSEREGGKLMPSQIYLQKFVAPEDQAMVAAEMARAVATTDPFYTRQFEQRIVRADGTPGVVMTRCAIVKDAAGRTVKIRGANQDITEQKVAEERRRELESQLRRAQKLEAVGTLAGGIAHDFNNILAGVMGNLQLAAMDVAAGDPVLPFLQEAEKASRRGRDLVKRILTFSQRREQHREPSALGPVVREALGLLRASLPATIDIRADLDDAGPNVLCDVGQIHEVIMNLGINAAAAIGDGGGWLEVKLHHGAPEPALLAVHPQVGRQHRVCVIVRDNGCGMSPEVLERIFEPFFTTKAAGGGTGLGLAMVHGIMHDHGGAIVVESDLGAGSTFHLFFPEFAPDAAPAADAAPERPVVHRLPTLGSGERVLVVDDDRAVLSVAAGILRRCGYRPEAFSDPTEALAAFQREPAAYKAIVTDLTMPEMTGLELARSLVALQPRLPVIIASGHLFPEIVEEAKVLGATRFLQKPYDFKDLAAELHFALGRPGDRALPAGA